MKKLLKTIIFFIISIFIYILIFGLNIEVSKEEDLYLNIYKNNKIVSCIIKKEEKYNKYLYNLLKNNENWEINFKNIIKKNKIYNENLNISIYKNFIIYEGKIPLIKYFENDIEIPNCKNKEINIKKENIFEL